MALCADASIATFVPRAEKPWDVRKSMHLFRRTSFGAKSEVILNSLGQAPANIVHEIVNRAVAMPATTAPVWANWTLSNYSSNVDERNTQIASQILEWRAQWLVDMKNNGLRDRMSFFWSNHFVTKIESYICPSWMYRYHQLLQKYALGNFKSFVRDVGLTPAMLIFLNNIQNTSFLPNENYARELLELFTLGVDNGYTQADIVDVARAISGWNGIDQVNLCGDVAFIPLFWDSGQKTIFGKTGNWSYDDVINLIFSERAVQVSEYICRKLYVHFINAEVNEDVVKAFAKIFRDENFEIAPLMKVMFSSEHFFDDASVGTILPGHIEYFLSFINEIGYEADKELMNALAYSTGEFNQQIFSPTDVAGWPGNRNWLNSASFPFRTEGIRNIMIYFYSKNGNALEELRTMAKNLAGSATTDAAFVSRAIIDYLLPNGLQNASDYADALAEFKAEIPENYFVSGQWNLDWEYAPAQVAFLVNYLSNLPEFQLK